MLHHMTLTIIVFLIIAFIQVTKQELTGQNDTIIETTTFKLSVNDKMKKYLKEFLSNKQAVKTGNMTNSSTIPNKTIMTPPNKLFHEYLRCRQLSSINKLPTPYSCPYEFEEDIRVCWKATYNGTYAWDIIEYDHGYNNFYDGVRYGIENCTLQRFCQNNGTWAMTVPPEIQCKTCIGDGRPVKFNSISIMIETMSLSLSLISLTIAILCMINVKYVAYFYVKIFRLQPSDVNQRIYPSSRSPKPNFFVTSSVCRCLLTFRRLHLPRNLLHMHLFVAFIFRSIVKLAFIHLIIGGYTRTMISYTRDKCGNIEILSKSSNLFHVIGCRILSSLYWYTDAVSQTFIFCEAMFLFTALTSHLFRDRGCLLFVLWGWLSPFVWLTMWIASHIITDKLKHRSTCWLEADNTTYFYYFFYVPYAFYLLINFGIFIFLVRLLYSKYQSNYIQSNRTGNRHLIKSILILIPLFGLHSLFVMWVFYHKNQGHTVWYYIAVIFKAVFGDLQGFFTSLIYFYFNTEIRYEVLRHVRRTLLRNDNVRNSSVGDTLSTRLSVFRISYNRRRHSSIPNRNERRRTTTPFSPPTVLKTRQICWKKFLAFICPCLFNKNNKSLEQEQQQLPTEPINQQNEISPAIQSNLIPDGGLGDVISPLLVQNCPIKSLIDNDGLTCDTVIIKNEHDNDFDDELLSDENDVTIHQTSFGGDQTSMISNHTPLLTRNNNENYRIRSKSDANTLKDLGSKYSDDNKSLR